MTDKSFFNFPNMLRNDEMTISEDDPEYDLLNDETFGNAVLTSDDDWEEQHEKLSKLDEALRHPRSRGSKSDSEGREEDVDVNGMSEEMARFVLQEDDDFEDYSVTGSTSENSLNQQTSHEEPDRPYTKILQNPDRCKPTNRQSQPDTGVGKNAANWFSPTPATQHPMVFKQILTLEEIERELTKPNANIVNKENVTSVGASGALGLVNKERDHILQRPSTPNIQIAEPQFGYSRLPPPQLVPPSQPRPLIQARPINFNVTQPPQVFAFPIPVAPRFPMPVNPMRPALIPRSNPSQIFPRDLNDYQMMESRGRLPNPDFHVRQTCQRGRMIRGDPFGRSQQNFRRHPGSNAAYDEYAGLMTENEKNWLAQIQQLQLNSMNPTKEDYYHTTYMSRRHGSGNRNINPGGSRNIRDNNNSKPAYAPLQFENSLGKLQVGSVIAPRKIIDTDVVENVECTSQASTPNTKQLLLELEQMHNLILQIEDNENNPPVGGNPLISRNVADEMACRVTQDARFNTYMSIRKGRSFILRLLPYVKAPESLVHKLIASMVPASRKDNEDQILLSCLPFIRFWLATVDLQTLVKLAKEMENSLSYILTNKFTISIVANMIERAEHLLLEQRTDSREGHQWVDFITRLVGCVNAEAESSVKRPERPVVGIDPNCLSRHLARCKSIDVNQSALLLKTLSNLNSADPSKK